MCVLSVRKYPALYLSISPQQQKKLLQTICLPFFFPTCPFFQPTVFCCPFFNEGTLTFPHSTLSPTKRIPLPTVPRNTKHTYNSPNGRDGDRRRGGDAQRGAELHAARAEPAERAGGGAGDAAEHERVCGQRGGADEHGGADGAVPGDAVRAAGLHDHVQPVERDAEAAAEREAEGEADGAEQGEHELPRDGAHQRRRVEPRRDGEDPLRHGRLWRRPRRARGRRRPRLRRARARAPHQHQAPPRRARGAHERGHLPPRRRADRAPRRQGRHQPRGNCCPHLWVKRFHQQ